MKNDKEYYKIYKEILRIKMLDSTDKILISLILSYTERELEFLMSTQQIVETIKISSATINRSISKQKKLGLFIVVRFMDKTLVGGQRRSIRINEEKLNYLIKNNL